MQIRKDLLGLFSMAYNCCYMNSDISKYTLTTATIFKFANRFDIEDFIME